MTTFLVYRDLLGPEANGEVYRESVARQHLFEQSRVVHRGVDLDTRASRVVYAHQLGGLATGLVTAVRARVDEASERLGIPPFDISSIEVQLTSHNDGDFFTRHTDSASAETATRTLTFVYYFHAEPPRFTGGELSFDGTDGREVLVRPGNDTLVMFDPRTRHAVRRISCPSRRFADGRFALTGWVHRSSRARSRSTSFFDMRVFTPVGRWAPPPARPRLAGTARNETPGHGGSLQEAETGAADLLRLYGDLHRAGAHPDRVDVRPQLSGRDFLACYYSQNRPVVLPGVLADTPAARTWSPDHLASRFGDVRVQITAGRESSPDYERHFGDTVRTVSLRELATMLAEPGESNDFYLVARNNFFENPRLRELRDELRPPGDIVNDADRRPGATKLWIGPSGTVTPLHHDEHSILFVQVHGTKEFKLVPSFDRGYVYPRHRYYSEVDPEAVDLARFPLFARASVMDVTVGPGDGLFIPAGWWHWARSRSVSISATFSSFAWPFVNTHLRPAPTGRHTARAL